MSRHSRTFVGGAVMITFVIGYALLAMALAQARPVQEAPGWLQPVLYAVIGLAWIVPLLPLIRWMEGKDRG